MHILTLNTGSSSLKFAVYDMSCTAPDGGALLRSGAIEGIGSARSRARIRQSDSEQTFDASIPDRAAALSWLTRDLERERLWEQLSAVGHRIVHGGAAYREPVRITADVRAALQRLVPLAPVHLRDELHAVDVLAQLDPDLAQVACFDTAFHGGLPLEARWYGLPRALVEEGVMRYGFHGLSYEYIVRELRSRDALGMRTIVAHLGSGASMAALREGRSIDTSMGLTPLGGFMMSTRSGDLDPGILLYLMRERGRSLDDVSAMVTTAGGLLGLSGTSADMRDLLARCSADTRAAEAVSIFCYQARRFLGAYVAVLGGLDTLVFTGGIGEHAPIIRECICRDLDCVGIRIDPARNDADAAIISERDARVTVHVIQTNEEFMIAHHTARVLRANSEKDHD
ncbi:MAG TPA: acetate/propionate family kinase [Gemmatimonadaceae bacterium]|nr:acetate/propionate family kinase [Gemmatimonadaceae bacterium]